MPATVRYAVEAGTGDRRANLMTRQVQDGLTKTLYRSVEMLGGGRQWKVTRYQHHVGLSGPESHWWVGQMAHTRWLPTEEAVLDAYPDARPAVDRENDSRFHGASSGHPFSPQELHVVTDGRLGTPPEATEMDWRLTEVIPEDFYAMQADESPEKYAGRKSKKPPAGPVPLEDVTKHTYEQDGGLYSVKTFRPRRDENGKVWWAEQGTTGGLLHTPEAVLGAFPNARPAQEHEKIDNNRWHKLLGAIHEPTPQELWLLTNGHEGENPVPEVDYRPNEMLPEDFYAMRADESPLRYGKSPLYTWSVDPSGDPDRPHRLTVIRRKNQQGWPLFSSLHRTPEEAEVEGRKTVRQLLRMTTLIDRLKSKPKGEAVSEPVKESVGDAPVRYAGEELPVDPAIRGTKLQHFLTTLASHPELSEQGRQWAKEALGGQTGALWALSDELHDTDHPLAGKYNLLNAPAGIHLDRSTGHALSAVGERTDDPLDHLYMALDGNPHAHPSAVEAINEVRKSLRPPTTDKPTVGAGTMPEGTPDLRSHVTPVAPAFDRTAHHTDLIRKSLDRHRQRLERWGSHDSEGSKAEAIHPLPDDPERYGADMGDYDPLPIPKERQMDTGTPGALPVNPAPKTSRLPRPSKRNLTRLSDVVRAVKERERQRLSKVTPPPQPQPAPTPTATWQPTHAKDVYRKAEVPERYRSSPALSDFISAVRNLRSSSQDARRQIAEAQFRRLKLKVDALRDAVADSPVTASANVAAAVSHAGDADRVRAAGALLGLELNSPSLLLFHEGDGQQMLHKLDVVGSAEKLRRKLDEAGLTHRTLLPTDTGWSVCFYDPDGSLAPAVQKVAQQVGSEVQTSTGTGEVIGGGGEAEGDKDSRRSYRSILRSYERSQQAHAGVQQGQSNARTTSHNQPTPPATGAGSQPAPADGAAPTGTDFAAAYSNALR